MPPPSAEQLGEIRRLARNARTDFRACRDLLTLLLNRTVLAGNDPGLQLHYLPGRQGAQLGGRVRPIDPLHLRDGRYLRVALTLFVEHSPEGDRLKVSQSSFQYQADPDPGTNDWIFRYDYLREPGQDPHPHSHLQIHGNLLVPNVLPANRPLERIHFPTRRMPLEGVIRLLTEQFQVDTAAPADFWRPLLAEAENAFLGIAHDAPLGPAE